MSVIFINGDIKTTKILSDEGLFVMDTVENAMISFKDHNFYHVIFSDSALEFLFLHDYSEIYPNLHRKLKEYRNKHNHGLLPIGSSMLYTMNYKHSVICSVISKTEFSDISYTNNLYYATKAMLELWPEEGFLIINTNNITIDKLETSQIINGIRDYQENKKRDNIGFEFNFNTFYIPGYNQIYESELEQSETYYTLDC